MKLITSPSDSRVSWACLEDHNNSLCQRKRIKSDCGWGCGGWVDRRSALNSLLSEHVSCLCLNSRRDRAHKRCTVCVCGILRHIWWKSLTVYCSMSWGVEGGGSVLAITHVYEDITKTPLSHTLVLYYICICASFEHTDSKVGAP